MSIKIEIIADSIAELAQTLRDLSVLYSVSVDNDKQVELATTTGTSEPPKAVSETTAGEGDASTPEPSSAAFSEPEPETPPPPAPITLKEICDVLTDKFKSGDAETKQRIVDTRNSLGLKFLSQAKDEHLPALRELVAILAATGN